jgi:hypothetical protein
MSRSVTAGVFFKVLVLAGLGISALSRLTTGGLSDLRGRALRRQIQLMLFLPFLF